MRRLEHQRVDQDVGRDVDKRHGPDDGGTRGVGGAQEDVVHALDGPGAVLGLAQVQGDDLGTREGDLQGLFVDRQPQTRPALGQARARLVPMKPAPPAIRTFLPVKSISPPILIT